MQCYQFICPVFAEHSTKSCDKSSQTEAGECTCSCHQTPAPPSPSSESPGGEEEEVVPPSDGEMTKQEVKPDETEVKQKTPEVKQKMPEVTQKTPEEEAYDLMVNGEYKRIFQCMI